MTRPTAGRPRGAPLTREVVLRTALEIIDRDGVEALSMRRLGEALGRDPMSLYRHAANKAALLDGIAEVVLDQLTVDTTDDDWAAQLRAVARAYRDLALAHPNVVPLLVTRPLATPLARRPLGTLRPLEACLDLLTRAGFTDVDALHIYRSLFGFLHGHVLDELQELVHNPEESDDLLRLGLHRLPLREFPRLRALAPVLAAYDGATELERGLDLLLAGLRAHHPRRPASDSTTEKGSIMDNLDQTTGKIKQAVGDLTGNRDLQREGKADERAGNVEEVVEHAADKAEHAVDKAKELTEDARGKVEQALGKGTGKREPTSD